MTGPETDRSAGPGAGSKRLLEARRRLAVAEADLAAARARRRCEVARRAPAWAQATLVGAVVGMVLVIVATVGAGAIALRAATAADPRDDAEAALAAACSGIADVLTADPGSPDRYLEKVRAISSGEFRTRIDASAPALTEAVSGLGGPTTGTVTAAGVLSPEQVSEDDPVNVLMVAEGTGTRLLGGTGRLVLLVRMVHGAQGWTVDRTQQR